MLELPEPLWVSAAEQYPIYVGYDLLKHPDLIAKHLAGKQVFILTHPEIASHYLPTLIQTCRAAGALQVDPFIIPSGEQIKTLETAQQIWLELLQHHHERQTTVIALGGGVIGDLAGFCAACYLRGVRIIHCPTTLLAQVDASIGGKTGVNMRFGKNLIGAFYQPTAVIADLTTLSTLPYREFIAGLAELIKYGMALDSVFFEWLEKNLTAIIQRKPEALTQAINWAVKLKSAIITQDEKDRGQRMLLNFGHTIAHALESLLEYQQMLHGEAVAIGMVVATRLSVLQGNLPPEVLERLIFLLKSAELPTQLPPTITASNIWTKLKHDKKRSGQRLQWILLNALGEAKICKEVDALLVSEALK